MKKWLLSRFAQIKNSFTRAKVDEGPRTSYLRTALLSLILVVIGINAFIEITDTLGSEKLVSLDREVTDWVLSFRSPGLTRFFIFITNIGDVRGYLISFGLTLIIAGVFIKRWKYVLQIFLVLILASLSNMVLKRAIERARPEIEHLVTVKTLSYPSGHAMSAMAFYGFMIYLVWRLKVHWLVRSLLMLLLAFLILSIGTSRIYLGVHFPTDVLGGFIAGLIWVFFCIFLFNLIDRFRRDPRT